MLAPEYREHTLRGLAGFDFCWVISFMHLNTGWRRLVKPPRGPRTRQGVFATRAPHRPNPLALSALRITNISESEGRVTVRGLDLLDGTPVLDIKPYVRVGRRCDIERQSRTARGAVLTAFSPVRAAGRPTTPSRKRLQDGSTSYPTRPMDPTTCRIGHRQFI